MYEISVSELRKTKTQIREVVRKYLYPYLQVLGVIQSCSRRKKTKL